MQKDLPLYQLFQQVFYEQYKTLCQYAYTFIKDTDACEDIVQDLFMKVWEKKKDLLGKNEIRFYLFTAVRNNCLTNLAKKRKSVVNELTGQEMDGEPVDFPLEGKPEVDFTALLAEAFERLPPKCRAVFVMSRVGKLTYQQIADASGISIKTVENQMGKALGIMRVFIKEKQVHFIQTILFLSVMGLHQ
ncbi:MAG: polymerase sigma-70 factor [Ferruginibacter sp.]|nr:polymerase sigma-70 factor [Ferruginibacter sp.]